MENYYSIKEHGETNHNNKKKNEGHVGTGRSASHSHADRTQVRLADRYSHHSRRRVLDEGIGRGAQSMWMPSTTCKQKRNRRGFYKDREFQNFNKMRYRGDICQLLEKNKRTVEENELIKQMCGDISIVDLNRLNCRRCRYYYQMLQELPDLSTVDQLQDVKEMYRNRNFSENSKFSGEGRSYASSDTAQN